MDPLLLLCFIHSIFQAKAQDYPAPALTVDPAVISETNNVTLNCQTHHVQEPTCYFLFDRKHESLRSCQIALSGTDLLSMVKKRPPAEITVTCFYDSTNHPNYRSAHSAERSITVSFAPPSLTLNSSVITEKDKVKLHCRPPPSVSSNRCHFYTTDKNTWNNSRCEQTLRGSDLLTENQTPPVEVQIQCFYVVEREREVSPSQLSEKISVTVQRITENKLPNPQRWPKPEISFQKHDDEVIISCSSPLSATGSKCNLYFGESTQPHQTINSRTNTKETELFCQFYISDNDFRINLSKVQRQKVSCDYTLGDGSRSPQSDEHTSQDFVSKFFPNQTHETTAPFFPVKTATRPNHVTGSDSETPSAGLAPPSLTMNSSVITKEEKIKLHCRPPPPVSSNLCHFNTTDGQTWNNSGCEQTLRGSDLLTENQSPPVDIQIMCYYVVQQGQTVVTSLHSELVFVTVQIKTTTRPNQEIGSDSETPSAEVPNSIWKWLIPVIVCGTLLVCIILVLAIFCTKRRNANHRKNCSHDDAVVYASIENHPMKPVVHKPFEDDDKIYTLITSVPTADCSKGSVNVLSHESTDDSEPIEDDDKTYTLITSVPDCSKGSVNVMSHESTDDNESSTYHLYCTIPDLETTTSGSVDNVLYSSPLDLS